MKSYLLNQKPKKQPKNKLYSQSLSSRMVLNKLSTVLKINNVMVVPVKLKRILRTQSVSVSLVRRVSSVIRIRILSRRKLKLLRQSSYCCPLSPRKRRELLS